MQISAQTYFQDIIQAKKQVVGQTTKASEDTIEIFKYLIGQVERFDFKKPRMIRLFEENYQFKLDREKSNVFIHEDNDSGRPLRRKKIVFKAVSPKAPIQSIEFTPNLYENEDEPKSTNKYSMIAISFLNNGSISYYPKDGNSKRIIGEILARV